MFDRARGRAADLGYAAGWGLVKSAPFGLSRRGFRAGADIAAVRNGAGARQLRANLRRVVGPGTSEHALDELVHDALRSYSRYWLETFRLPRMDHAALIRHTLVENGDLFADVRSRGKGVVLALPHMGNWDAGGLWLVETDGSFATVAERLRPESLYDRFVAYRESLGFEVLPLTGGARSPVEVLKERLAQDRVVCLLADRDLSHNGVEVQFFGEAARMPGGPAMLAVLTGAPLLAVRTFFTEDGWGLTFGEEIEAPGGRLRDQVTAMTQRVADVFEKLIADRPADWHMLQKLWLADLEPRTPAAAPSRPVEAG